MRPVSVHVSVRRLRALLGLIGLVALLALGPAAAGAMAQLSIAVQGNHFVNGAGETVRLLGVNHPSFEYACVDGYGYDDGHMDAPDAAAIAAWHATAVRIPLNEDCWLGVNGQPDNSQEPLTVNGYRQAVEEYVRDLNEAGLYAILDLHWTAPGSHVADGQRPMPDDHSVAFWQSVASTFATNHAVVFDAFNEPYSPAAVNDPSHPVNWSCWESGGCTLPVVNDSESPNGQTYTAVGMQAVVNAIRGTGASQPILLGGLSYANDLSEWLSHEPSDPDGQLVASFHNYEGETCDTATCWNAEVAPVAARVPVVTGEFDQEVCAPSSFDDTYMNWADEHGVSYLAWGWWVLSQQEISSAGCGAYYLITDPAGTPAAPNGVALHDHLSALFLAHGGTGGGAAGTPGPSSAAKRGPHLRVFRVRLAANGSLLKLLLQFDRSGHGMLSAATVRSFASGSGRHHLSPVRLGTARFKAKANKEKTVVLRLSPPSHTLLVQHHKLKVRFTISFSDSAGQRAVAHRTSTLEFSPRHG